jgi:hypothetical protein
MEIVGLYLIVLALCGIGYELQKIRETLQEIQKKK